MKLQRPREDGGRSSVRSPFEIDARTAQRVLALPPEAQERVYQRVGARMRERLAETAAKSAADSARLCATHERMASEETDSIKEWALGALVLEKNDCSRLHKLIEASAAGRVFHVDDDSGSLKSAGKDIVTALGAEPSFVVQHDFAAAFARAPEFSEGAFCLPYSTDAPDDSRATVFEFRISGRTVIVFAGHLSDGGAIGGCGFVSTIAESWIVWGLADAGEAVAPDKLDRALTPFLWSHIRALCIALDAEVVTRELIRAPEKLNAAREKKGALPLHDYHVVRLHGRVVGKPPPMGGTHRSPRLHMRRGHWRHYTAHKTWIRWTLVGDPDLGFVEKEYRL